MKLWCWSVTFVVVQIVPENPDPEVADDSPSKLAAIEVNTMLKNFTADPEFRGEPKGACKKLADELCKEVEQSVQSFQTDIKALPDGYECEAKGQNEVQHYREEVVRTETEYKVTTQQAEEASNAPVHFGVYYLSSLDESVCRQFWKDPAYTAAKKAARIAAERATDARFAFKSATEQYEESLHRAAEERWKCQCAVRSNYNLRYRTATKGKNEEANAYKKCNHMKCYLNNTSADQCKFTIPTVQGRQFGEYGVPKNECQATYRESTVTLKTIQKTVVDCTSETKLSLAANNDFVLALGPVQKEYFQKAANECLATNQWNDKGTPMLCCPTDQCCCQTDKGVTAGLCNSAAIGVAIKCVPVQRSRLA